MNKKTVLAISLVGTVVGFLITGLTMLKFWCGPNGYACWDRLEFVGNLLLIFLPAFVFSIITYFLREEVFRAWLRFAYWWIPVSLVFIYLAGSSFLPFLTKNSSPSSSPASSCSSPFSSSPTNTSPLVVPNRPDLLKLPV